MPCLWNRLYRTTNCAAILLACIFFLLGSLSFHAQIPDQATVIRGIDDAVQARIDHVASYSVVEHYSVFRGNSATPAAEMLVRTEYKRQQGKSFTVLSQTGSAMIRSELQNSVLANEIKMSQPGLRETILVNSANYAMTLQPAAPTEVSGHTCLQLAIHPRRSDPSLFEGTLWVDAKSYAIVQLTGKTAKSHSLLTSAAQVLRQYTAVSGFPMATHATATTHVALYGDTTVQIYSSDYHVELVK